MSMSAEDVGKKLLEEVEETTLSELLQEIHTAGHDQTSAWFGVPPLDRLCSSTSDQHRLTSTSKGPPVVELLAAVPAVGRRHLMYLALAAAVLPKHLSPSDVSNGPSKQTTFNGGCAVVIDLDHDFDVLRLSHIMRQLLKPAHEPANDAPADQATTSNDQSNPRPAPSEADVTKTIVRALIHIHVFKPSSLPSLILTLESLPSYLAPTCPTPVPHQSSTRALTLLTIFSLTTFLEQARFVEETARLDPDPQATGPPDPNSTPAAYIALVRHLRRLQATFSTPILATSFNVLTVPRDADRPVAFKHVLPGAWRNFITLRLGFNQARVRPFMADITIEGAERDRDMRQKAVLEAPCAAWPVGDGETAVATSGGFRFLVHANGRIEFM